jgi:hypothetical protein
MVYDRATDCLLVLFVDRSGVDLNGPVSGGFAVFAQAEAAGT